MYYKRSVLVYRDYYVALPAYYEKTAIVICRWNSILQAVICRWSNTLRKLKINVIT